MSLAAADLRSQFAIVGAISDERLTMCLLAANRTLNAWLTAAVVSDDSDSDQVEAVEYAQSLLAIYHLLLNTGARIRKDGIVKTEQDSGASVSNNATHEYFTPDELAKLRREYWQQAIETVEPYRPSESRANSSGTVTIKSSVAGYQ